MTVSQIVMSVVGSAVLLVGYLLAQRGKKGDQEIQETKDQFQRMVDEAKYWREQTSGSRAEFEGRWDRQIARCRRITEQASATIADLMKYVPSNQQRDASDTLGEIEQHRQDDHTKP